MTYLWQREKKNDDDDDDDDETDDEESAMKLLCAWSTTAVDLHMTGHLLVQ